jgi:hypothetical protein
VRSSLIACVRRGRADRALPPSCLAKMFSNISLVHPSRSWAAAASIAGGRRVSRPGGAHATAAPIGPSHPASRSSAKRCKRRSNEVHWWSFPKPWHHPGGPRGHRLADRPVARPLPPEEPHSD